MNITSRQNLRILEVVSFHKQQKMLKFGVGGGGGGEDDVEKVGRTSGKILTKHLLKPETEQ